MFALGGRKASSEPVSGPLAAAGGGMFVLPRPARRLVRLLTALATGRVDIPRHVGTVSAAALLAATGLYGMALGGHTHAVLETSSSTLGFAIDKVTVDGNVETSDIDILQQLNLDGATSLVALDADKARKALMALPWVEGAEVRKVYPDTVDVKLAERKPFGIWQHGSELSVIERSGSVIEPFSDRKFETLPLFVGLGAERRAADFAAVMDRFPDLKARARAYIRVSDRRWDIRFDNGVTVKLPEHDVERALADLSTIERERGILGKDIVAVDFRLDDRITVQLTPTAAAARDEAIAKRNKALKAAEKRA